MAGDSNSKTLSGQSVRVRMAEEGENLDPYRSWLPQAFLSLPSPVFFLAENTESGEVVGLGSLRLLRERGKKAGRFQLYVLPDWRRKGVGNKVMEALMSHAKEAGVTSMLAGVGIAEGSGECAFFESMDRFRIMRTIKLYEVKTDDGWEVIKPLAERILQKGKYSRDYEIVSLEKADAVRVRDFVLKYLGGIPDALANRLQGGKNGFLPKLSLVIRSQQGPVAVLLIRRGEKGLVVDTRVVAPEVRGTWANVALMYAFGNLIRGMGVEKFYFEGDDQLHKDTIKLANRFGGKLVENNHLYGCDL